MEVCCSETFKASCEKDECGKVRGKAQTAANSATHGRQRLQKVSATCLHVKKLRRINHQANNATECKTSSSHLKHSSDLRIRFLCYNTER